jgi:transposase
MRRTILFEVTWAIAHTKDNFLSTFYHRMARRHGKKKAIMTPVHKVLVSIYHILRTKKPYTDLWADYFDQRDRGRSERPLCWLHWLSAEQSDSLPLP